MGVLVTLMDCVQVGENYLVLFQSSVGSGTAELKAGVGDCKVGTEFEAQFNQAKISKFEVLASSSGLTPEMEESDKPGDYRVTGLVEALRVPEIYDVRVGEARLSVDRDDPGAAAKIGDWVKFRLHGLVLHKNP